MDSSSDTRAKNLQTTVFVIFMYFVLKKLMGSLLGNALYTSLQPVFDVGQNNP